MLATLLARLRKSFPPGSEEHLSVLAGLVKSSGIYALGSVGAPLIALVLSPFLAHNLSPTNYGVYAVFLTAMSLSAGVIQLGLGSAFFRAYNYDFTSPAERRFVGSTAIVLLFALSSLFAAGISLAAPAIARTLFSGTTSASVETLAGLVRLAALAVLCQNLSVPGFAWLRAQNRASAYVLLTLVNIVVNLGVTVALVGAFQLGVAGALIGLASGYGIAALVTVPLLLARSGLHLSRVVALSMLAFGAPQIGSVVSFWVLQLSDRYLLSRFASYAETASYAVAYTLGSVLSVIIIGPFTLAWPTALYSIAKREDAPHIFGMVFRWFGLLLMLATFGFSIVSIVLLNTLFPKSYGAAAPVIPLVALAIAFNGAYLMFVTGISVLRRTPLTIFFTGSAAVVNVGLNLALIPRFGAMGAAVSTLLAYIVLALTAYGATQRIYPIPFPLRRWANELLLGCGIYVASYAISQRVGGIAGLSMMVAGFLAYCAALVCTEWRPASPRSVTTILAGYVRRH